MRHPNVDDVNIDRFLVRTAHRYPHTGHGDTLTWGDHHHPDVARGRGHWVPYGILNETNFQTFATIIKYGIMETWQKYR